ncbi:MAG: ABC transporter substrate-binding protein [Deltaproteobacteria bacterium]|nr:ABC transporter substrate-binding protein [Deltaproteobacteria bacterium]
MRITLAYSVDADDAFMFHGLAADAVDGRGFAFVHQRGDTAWLNALAAAEGADVVAVSAGAYPSLADKYLLLPHGMSVGRGFGPVLVSRRPMRLDELSGRRVAVPGLSTTAFLVLRLMQPEVVPVVVPVAPFAAVFDALERGQVDAALLIHEGRLLFERRGYLAVAELGQWWSAETGLPLPLGANVIRRALGAQAIAAISEILRESLAYAFAHRAQVIRAIAGERRGDAALFEAALLDRYLGMYANDDTRAVAPDVRRAIDVLFARAAAAGLLPAGCTVEWAP